jgi:hypothetical protein
MVQYLNTLEDYKYLPTNKVACKKCLVVMDFVYGRDHGVTCYVNPTDKAGLVTCIKCCRYDKPKLPPRDVVSVYHNRRKLRIRKR